MFIKIISRIYRIFAVSIVGIPARLTGASAREMLHHGVYTVFAPAVRASFRSLKAVAVGFCHGDGKLRMFPEGVRGAHPAGFCSKIYLW